MAKESFKPLSWKPAAIAAEEAKAVIDEGRTGEQLALFSRHEKVKKALLGGWRFNNNYAVCGMSGVSKSYYVNMLHQDFLNKELNKEFKKPFKIIHFCFEMSAFDEVLRSASGQTSTSYRDLLSVDGILSSDQYNEVDRFLAHFKDLPIYYVESTGNVGEIEATIMAFQTEFPNHHLIISCDHTLLADYDNESNEVELVTNLSKMFVRIRKKINSMNIEVVQLNADIEEVERITNPVHHYPKKKDIHGAKAVYRDADYVIVLHAPEKLGIQRYGMVEMPNKTRGYPTEKLIAWHLLKARKGVPGLIRMKDELHIGNIAEWTQADDDAFFKRK